MKSHTKCYLLNWTCEGERLKIHKNLSCKFFIP